MMRLLVVAGLLGALAIPVAALGATLEKGAGTSCPSGTSGAWKFVNNKTEGAPPGHLTIIFDLEEFGVTTFGPVTPDEATFGKANRNSQNWTMFTNGGATLLSASTELPGKLVLASVTCSPMP